MTARLVKFEYIFDIDYQRPRKQGKTELGGYLKLKVGCRTLVITQPY